MIFIMALLKKYFVFLLPWLAFLNYTGSDPKIGYGIPKNTLQPDGRWSISAKRVAWPLERQKTPEFRGFFGVASFKMCKHGAADRA